MVVALAAGPTALAVVMAALATGIIASIIAGGLNDNNDRDYRYDRDYRNDRRW